MGDLHPEKRRAPWVYAILLILIGLVLIAGGGYLATLGGSLYYVLCGIAVAASGVLLLRGSVRGAQLYGLMLVGTLIWSIWEVGFSGWDLAPRLIAPAVLGLWLLMPWVLRQRRPKLDSRTVAAVAVVALVSAGLTVGAPKLVAQTGPAAAPPAPSADGDWPHYGNDQGGSRHSRLAQITPANVKDLEVAWTYRIGAAQDGKMINLQMTPLQVGGAVYICSSDNVVDSIDAETGQRNWRFDPKTDLKKSWIRACRGVSYYKVPDATGPCAERIYTATVDARLFALDAKTGQVCPAFGVNGVTDLSTGMGDIAGGYYSVTSPPTVVRGKLVIGGAVTDNQKVGEPSGVVRAYDAVTGQFAWAWDMGREGINTEPGPGEEYTRGTPNVWSTTSADEALGLVYLPTGNATPDYYGGHRRPFDEKYSASVVALDAETGAPRWSFQTVHHDIWDYDVPAQPTLIDWQGPNGVTPGLLASTKRGQIFFLDRRTGVPLTKVEEKPTPQGAVQGDYVTPTQPFSTGLPAVAANVLREKDMWGITPLDQLWCRIKFKEARYEGPFTPPGLKHTITYPGVLGGVDWGGVSVDPGRQLLVVNSNRMANYTRLVPRAVADAMGVKPRGDEGGQRHAGMNAQARTPYAAYTVPFLSPLKAPCQAPPYGELTVIDLKTQKVLWSKPLGTARDNGPLGIASHLPIPMGTPNTGGSITTGSGLIFIAATFEQTFRAIDASTGKILWQDRLPAGGQASPMTYSSPKSGRQFVVIAAGGHSILQSKTGDYVIAYALPK